ncbi:hypothetical protein HWV07_19285 [Natronomonas salina]|uniref:hypothetical protein n=1 Tax=Natronomonas salina TaxID=1710540 RepID=UPI0015B4E648|nr:hypothetical protein [Natronomonas salina]QLD91070.1 hypothetical protein HWV07_19285 [Natronomonas salina]
MSTTATDTNGVRVWLVERTYGDDEQNLVILTYATPDGERYLRKERALTSFTGAARETTAALDVEPKDLGETSPDDREYYADAARRTAERNDPDDAI